MRKQYILFAFLFFAATRAEAQAYGELNIGDVRARFYANGRVSSDTITLSSNFEVPQGGGASTVYSGGLWLGGQTSGGQTRVSSTMYDNDHGMHFFPGPLTTDGTASTTQTVSDAYNHVWSVTRAEIAAHLAYFNCLNDPGCDVAAEYPNGYTAPPDIIDWPAMGDVASGYSLYLAPFYDYNQDGNYNANDGDAPCILGDQALFSVFSDRLGTLNGNVPLGVEVMQMPFTYEQGDPALDQTVFIAYHLSNRSTESYANTMLGFFNDFDLGCSNDDFIGCDPSRNLAYVYNWDDTDEDCLGAGGYGAQPPAFGMTVIKGPFIDANADDDPVSNALPNWNGQGFGDGIADNERHGLSSFIYFNRNAPAFCSDPVSTMDYYNYLRGIWKDGVPMSYGGVGYSPDPNALYCSFMYPGSGDPVGAGTGGQVQGPWSESIPTPSLPDRRGLMSMGAFTLEAGQEMNLLFAYLYARASTGGALASVATLQERVDSVRAFALGFLNWDDFNDISGLVGDCADYEFLGIHDGPVLSPLTLFPTPASDVVQFTAPRELVGGLLSVRDATGRMVLQHRVVPETNIIRLEALSSGVYICEAVTRNARFTGRLVKR
ncbi:MAG: T9SS type A sorting domain-containing protein [Flavobacteriales bacterium]